MTSLQCRNIVFDYAAEPHDFDRMRSQGLLMVIAQSDEKEEPREEGDDDDADGSSRQELEMKMLGTEKPGGASSKNPPPYRRGRVRRVGLGHYKFKKAGILPDLWSEMARPSVGGRKAKSVPDVDQK